MKKLLAISVLIITFGCQPTVDQSPREINLDRDVCVNCLMGLTEQKYSVQSINHYGDVLWFDDLGCLIQYMGTDDWTKYDGSTAKMWIGDCETGEWLDAEKAWYRFGDRTPMGYGYGALKTKNDSTFDFKTTVKRIHDGLTKRDEFMKMKKGMK